MNRSDTIWAMGTPKNVQLACRSVSRANRTTPYQMKNVSARSPTRSRFRSRKPSQIRNAAPSNPDSDSYRKSGWNRVVSNGKAAHG